MLVLKEMQGLYIATLATVLVAVQQRFLSGNYVSLFHGVLSCSVVIILFLNN